MKVTQPPELPPGLESRWQRVAQRLEAVEADAAPGRAREAARVGAISEFALQVLERRPTALLERLEDDTELSVERVTAMLNLDDLPERDALKRLRHVRQVEMARIAWRDLTGRLPLETGMRELSALADGSIEAALRHATGLLEPRFGVPRNARGEPAPLLVLGMGKLGGRELNFSSDVDLVFLYADDAALDGRDADEVEAYYLRLAQTLIKLLDQRTEDGFVFRVDTRLRPFGQSGPLVLSVAAFESYLVRHGRDWERYAYVKARLITGREYERDLFAEILEPFVFRRYLDYGVFDALRQMKQGIAREVARKDMVGNIKLGPGGIREIEFIVQALQLVRGGREPALREPRLLAVLPRLGRQSQLGTEAAAVLEEAYRYLRTFENRLQALEDQQTHEIPTDPALRDRLGFALEAPDWPALEAALEAQRALVESEFRRLAWDARVPAEGGVEADAVRAAWEAGTLSEALEGSPLSGDGDALRQLDELRHGALYQRMDEVGRQRLAELVMRIVPLLEAQAAPARTLSRLLPIVQAICRRSAYLALLNENPATLERLLGIAAHSSLLARQIAQHPLLLDELLDARIFERPPTREELSGLFAQQLQTAGTGDVEASLEAMRQFQRAAVFRVAVADRYGRLPLMKVSDLLTETAEIILRFALDLAWRELVEKYGRPIHGRPPDLEEAGLAVVGYGKLGGFELGYGSDLDLVFLHDSAGAHQETDGPNPVDNSRFFVRLVQRVIHFLSIQTSSGRLYQIDTRLRPSGGAGLMVASLDNFRRYQREQAWIWEQQALLRSRAVAGSEPVCRAFEQERRAVLVEHVNRERLREEVRKMRLRMRAELSQSERGEFDIKQDPGGLTDIEFLIDYWVLANAREHAELVEFPDKIRQLEALERVELISSAYAEGLRHAYIALRERVHELALDESRRVVEGEAFAEQRDWVASIWGEVFGADGAS